jgi:hypothetical protein
LAHELIASLGEGEDPDAGKTWIAEIERRAREADSGSVELEDWATVRAKWAARWRKQGVQLVLHPKRLRPVTGTTRDVRGSGVDLPAELERAFEMILVQTATAKKQWRGRR